MTKQEALDHTFVTYWWNMGTKTKDFSGTYKQWFKDHKITITVKHEREVIFSGSYGSINFKINYQGIDYIHQFNLIIKLCLMYLGDKAMLIDGFNREYKINWR